MNRHRAPDRLRMIFRNRYTLRIMRWHRRPRMLAGSPKSWTGEGLDDRGGDLGFRRGADDFAVRGVCAVRDASAACPPTSSAAPTPPIIWKTPGRNSSAPKSTSRPSTNCSRKNRRRSARKCAARTCCRCCQGDLRPEMVEALKRVKARVQDRLHHQQSAGQCDRQHHRPLALCRRGDGAVRPRHRIRQDRPAQARSAHLPDDDRGAERRSGANASISTISASI